MNKYFLFEIINYFKLGLGDFLSKGCFKDFKVEVVLFILYINVDIV